MGTRKQRRIVSEAVDQTKPAFIVICCRFDGLTDFCNRTGYPISTGYRWLRDGYIPPRRRSGEETYPHILATAEKAQIAMTEADFVQSPANDQDSPAQGTGQSDSAAAGSGLPPPPAAARPTPDASDA